MNRFNFLSALLLTAASWMPALVSAVPDRFGTLSNTFYILHPASITTSQLTTTATTPSKTVLNGYSSVAKSRLASYSALTGKAVQYGNYKIVSVVQKACPVSVPPTGYICHYITSTANLNYTSSQFSTSPVLGAATYIQSAINTGGNLDCAFKAYNPATLISSRTGGTCPGKSPTKAPTNAPSLTTATITNTFGVANKAGILTSTFNSPTSQAHSQLVAAYQSLVKKNLKIAFHNANTLTYLGTATLGTVKTITCVNLASTYKCNIVPAISRFNYNASNFDTPPAPAVANYIQMKINYGDLQKELNALYPGTPIIITPFQQ